MNTTPKITEPTQIEKQYAIEAAKSADFGENWLTTANRALALQNIAYQTNPPQCAPQEQYITAAQAHPLFLAGNRVEMLMSGETKWIQCTSTNAWMDDFYGRKIVFRAIKQAQPESNLKNNIKLPQPEPIEPQQAAWPQPPKKEPVVQVSNRDDVIAILKELGLV